MRAGGYPAHLWMMDVRLAGDDAAVPEITAPAPADVVDLAAVPKESGQRLLSRGQR